MTPTDNKKFTEDQHYVPQFYLKQWLDQDGGFYPVKIKDKKPPKLHIFKKNLIRVGFVMKIFFMLNEQG